MKRFLESVGVLVCALAALSAVPGKTGAQTPGKQSGFQQARPANPEGPAIQRLIRERLSEQDLRKLVTASHTVYDHPDLPAYYASKAHGISIKAENYERFARDFGDRVPPGGDSHFAAGRMAFYYHNAAQESLTEARDYMLLRALNEQARQKEGCFSCHSLHGQGGTAAPDLALEGTRGRSNAWLIDQFKDPQAHFPASAMPSLSGLTRRQLEVLSAFLRNQQ